MDDIREMTTSEILERLIHLRYGCIAERDKMLIDEIELKLLKLKMIEDQEEK